jgi:ribosome-binding protein aMBF1 (putative translation factor)
MVRRRRNGEDDAAFIGMGKAIVYLREQRGMERDELAEKIEEDPAALGKVEGGEVNADWATLRVIAYMLGLPLDALIELAEEHAPGEGGEEWRRWTREAEQERHPPADASRHGIESVAKCQFCGHSRPGM